MKNLKKITAMLVVIAMVFSLATVGVFASENTMKVDVEVTKASVGQGGETIVNVYVTSTVDATVTMPAIIVNFDNTNFRRNIE